MLYADPLIYVSSAILGEQCLYYSNFTEKLRYSEVKYSPQITQLVSQEQTPEFKLWLCSPPSVESSSRTLYGGAALSLKWGLPCISPNSCPPPGAQHDPSSPFLYHPTAMWANTLPLPRQGMPNLHNLIKFCILLWKEQAYEGCWVHGLMANQRRWWKSLFRLSKLWGGGRCPHSNNFPWIIYMETAITSGKTVLYA